MKNIDTSKHYDEDGYLITGAKYVEEKNRFDAEDLPHMHGIHHVQKRPDVLPSENIYNDPIVAEPKKKFMNLSEYNKSYANPTEGLASIQNAEKGGYLERHNRIKQQKKRIRGQDEKVWKPAKKC